MKLNFRNLADRLSGAGIGSKLARWILIDFQTWVSLIIWLTAAGFSVWVVYTFLLTMHETNSEAMTLTELAEEDLDGIKSIIEERNRSRESGLSIPSRDIFQRPE